MKLNATLHGHEYVLRIARTAGGVLATFSDREYDLRIHERDRNTFLILHGGTVFDCRVERRFESGFDVFVGTKRYPITVSDPKRLRGAFAASAHGHGAAQIVAPMPGKVVRIAAEAGAAVQAGQGIITVEAMKMQNELKSPKDGTVTALNVEVGATVNAGDVLAVIE